MNKISKTSDRFNSLLKALMVLYPLYTIAFWFNLLPTLPENFGYPQVWGLPDEINISAASIALRSYAFLIDIIPTVIVMSGLYFLYKLFQLYSKGIFFSQQNINYLQKIGTIFLLQVLARIIEQPLLSYVLTLDAPSGKQIISLTFNWNDWFNIMVAAIMILISWVMSEAKKLEDELALTV